MAALRAKAWALAQILLVSLLFAASGEQMGGEANEGAGQMSERRAARLARREYEKQAAAQHPLTPLGKSIKRVILVAMLPSVCRSTDWRGDLPRYLTRFLPRVPVINWNARQWRYEQDKRGIGKGDLVLVIGTGSVGCALVPKLRDTPECTSRPGDKTSYLSLNSIDRLWDKENTLKVHIPVRNLQELNMPRNIFGFDHIIPDNSFFKPMGGNDDLLNSLKRCWRNDKKKDLLYVARFQEYKGQLKFVQQADARLLRGFTVHFYGSGGHEKFTGRKYVRQIEETAQARGIKVIVHGRVRKEALMEHACRAGGQVIWPYFDNNPRAAYEGLYAGMPLFVSTTAGIPAELLEQSFVSPVPYNSSLTAFNAQLERFMVAVKDSLTSRKRRKEVVQYVETALNPHNVYWEICERIGVCAHTERIVGVVDDDDDPASSAVEEASSDGVLPSGDQEDAQSAEAESQMSFAATLTDMIGEI
eukprot:jgi/Tetstr1/424590/TSEL_015115.t1